MGKATIAPDQPNIRELIDDRKTGLLVDCADTGRLADAIQLLAKESDLRSELARNAASTVRERGMTWDQNAERVEILAKHLIKSHAITL